MITNNQSTHICINHTSTKTQKLLPIKIGGRILVLTTRCSGEKTKMCYAFSWSKNTAHGVRFLLRFNMYLFLAQCEQRYLFFGTCPSWNPSRTPKSHKKLRNAFLSQKNVPRQFSKYHTKKMYAYVSVLIRTSTLWNTSQGNNQLPGTWLLVQHTTMNTLPNVP